MLKNTQTKKETKGTVGTCSCRTGRFLYPGHWGDAWRPDGMSQHIFPTRHVESLGQKMPPGKPWETQRDQSMSPGVTPGEWVAPGGCLLVTSTAFLGAMTFPLEPILLLSGYTLFGKASMHLPSAVDKLFLRNLWVKKDWHFPFSFYISQQK